MKQKQHEKLSLNGIFSLYDDKELSKEKHDFYEQNDVRLGHIMQPSGILVLLGVTYLPSPTFF